MDPNESQNTEDSEEANDNRASEQENQSRKLAKIQNGIAVAEPHKLNNNTSNAPIKCPSSKILPAFTNGVEREGSASSGEPILLSNGRTPSTSSNFSSLPNGAASTSYLNPNSISHAESDIRNNVNYIFGIDKCPPKVSCSSDSSPEMDVKWSGGSSYVPESSMNNIGGGSIGSTSHGTCGVLRPNINGTRDGQGPSGLPKREQTARRDSSSGNEGDLSDVEDYCIYTYKGNDNEVVNGRPLVNPGVDEEQAVAGQPNSGRSSPEMDFLEMDFDPGPSCEQDTGDSDLASINEDIQNLTMDNVESDPVLLNDLSKVVARQQSATPVPLLPMPREHNVSNEIDELPPVNEGASGSGRVNKCEKSSQCMPSTSAGLRRWEATSLNRSVGCPVRESYNYHNTSGDLISPGDNRDTDAELWADNATSTVAENSNFNVRKNNLSSTLYHRMMAKKLMLNKQTAFNQSGDSNLESELCSTGLDGLSPIEKVMLWTEQEATVKQVTQIGTSACGPTAVINALLALDVPFSFEVLVKSISTRLREPGTPLPRYLMSRACAGTMHKDLMRGISLATNGAAISKFFPFYPERNVSLSHWLHHWISRGAAPIATVNLQNCGSGSDIPDAWHHQMIFGVSQAGIYMTNPLVFLPEQLVFHQLVSPSILLIRRADVIAHWNPGTDLTPLARLDHQWRKLNVLGQVVNIIRETMGERKQASNPTTGPSHIRIPASYQAGIILVMRSDSPAADELLQSEQLPLL